jgi:hypothetical protein
MRVWLRRRLTGIVGLVVVLGWSVPASAQASSSRPIRRVEVSVAGVLAAGAPLGTAAAELRPATGQVPFRLFDTETRLAAAPLVELRLGTALVRRIEVEGRASFGRPELRTTITADAEGAEPGAIAERIDQWMAEGAVLVMLDELRLGSAVPFVSGGGGYLRQLHEGLMVVDEGHLYHAGGGVKHWFVMRPRGAVRAAGVRADVRLYHVIGGFSLDDRDRRHLAASAAFFMVF